MGSPVASSWLADGHLFTVVLGGQREPSGVSYKDTGPLLRSAGPQLTRDLPEAPSVNMVTLGSGRQPMNGGTNIQYITYEILNLQAGLHLWCLSRLGWAE